MCLGSCMDRDKSKNPENFGILAVRTGLEPATSAVTGQHSNQLNYRTSISFARIWIAKVALFFNSAKK